MVAVTISVLLSPFSRAAVSEPDVVEAPFAIVSVAVEIVP